MKISWPGAMGDVRNNQIEAPGRYNFVQGAIYRLKLSDLSGRPGVDLYPTLEVVPANLRTDAYIAHSSIPLYFTEEDFEQVMGGNFLVKVIYLPNPQYADVAMTGGPEEVVSTRTRTGRRSDCRGVQARQHSVDRPHGQHRPGSAAHAADERAAAGLQPVLRRPDARDAGRAGRADAGDADDGRRYAGR